ncbi:TPA: AAA family ATPase [Providencia alcalifaciens]
MKIKKVEIEAFRAYKSKIDGTFDFTNDCGDPSDFVAIYAPNGFGKSSFYDAVEWAITNKLERLGGEYNKYNYENAAKITKDSNVGQKILRNKYAEDKVVTKVVVSTTREKLFERELPKLRSNARDMRFGDKNQRTNAFFRRVILSQDEIDRFLREAKPQERYTKFMDSFGGDIEIARKELSLLINDNDTELSALKKKREFLIEELNQVIDLSVFEHFNSVAAELNAVGEAIVLVDETFSAEREHQLNAHLVSRRHELSLLQQTNAIKSETLAERLVKIPEIELHFRNVEEQNIQLTKLLKGVANADKYQTLQDYYNKCVADQAIAYTSLKRLVDIAESIETFLKNEFYLIKSSKKQKTLTEEISKSYEQLIGFEQTLKELNTELKITDDRSLLLRNLVDNAGPTYATISTQRALLRILEPKISDKNITIQVEKAQLEKLNRELGVLSTLKITTNLLLTGNVGTLQFDQDKIEQLTRCNADLNLIETNNQTIRTTQKALAEQMVVHERLVAIGLDYLSTQPSNICPLCTTPHPSADTLLDNIKGQNLLSELSQENSKKLSLLSIRQRELTDTIQTITQAAIEAQMQQVNSLHKKLNEAGERLTQAEREKFTLEAEYKSLENRIVELENSVWGLPNDELLSRVNSESNELSIKRANLIEQQAAITKQISVFTESVKARDSELQSLTFEMDRKRSEHAYVTVLEYLNENAISASELKQHCEMKKNELDTEVLKYQLAAETLTGQCSVLQQQMMDDGTWIDFVQLKLQKEDLEVSIVRSQSAINAFYESLSSIIIVNSDDALENVKKIIIATIEESKRQAKDLSKLSDSIKLLLELMASFKPYIKRINLQEELSIVDRQIELRNSVFEALSTERDTIVDHLKSLINNFFYEDLINSIYRKIDPHPAFKKVEFKADFDSDKPGLNIVVSDEDGDVISPILYFSAAQTNILSLSVFLANALHAKDDDGNSVDVILIDDPIQSMDSINILSTIDLLRSICLRFNKQIIISTHDENFFGLLQRKIPVQVMGSKFLQLEKFGVVVPVEPFLN